MMTTSPSSFRRVKPASLASASRAAAVVGPSSTGLRGAGALHVTRAGLAEAARGEAAGGRGSMPNEPRGQRRDDDDLAVVVQAREAGVVGVGEPGSGRGQPVQYLLEVRGRRGNDAQDF